MRGPVIRLSIFFVTHANVKYIVNFSNIVFLIEQTIYCYSYNYEFTKTWYWVKKKKNGSKMKRGKSLNLKIENWTHMIFVVILKSLGTGNGAKTRLFRLHGKLVHAVFLIYCIKLHRQKSLKLKLNVFFFFRKAFF